MADDRIEWLLRQGNAEIAKREALEDRLRAEVELLDDLCCLYIRDEGDAAQLLADASDRLQAILEDPHASE